MERKTLPALERTTHKTLIRSADLGMASNRSLGSWTELEVAFSPSKLRSAQSRQPASRRPQVLRASNVLFSARTDCCLPRRFGSAQRGQVNSKLITPGPDAYQIVKADWQKAENPAIGREPCTIGMKTMKFFQLNDNPGPGSHEFDYASVNGPYFSVGKGPRSSQERPLYTDKYYDPKLDTGPLIR